MTQSEFILEYSCNQKAWHYNHGGSVENSNTFFTVIKPCTYKKAKLFRDYLQTLNINKNQYTQDLLLVCADNFIQLVQDISINIVLNNQLNNN